MRPLETDEICGREILAVPLSGVPEPGVHRARRDRVSEQRHCGAALVLRTLVMPWQVHLLSKVTLADKVPSLLRVRAGNKCCSATTTGRHFPIRRFLNGAGTKRDSSMCLRSKILRAAFDGSISVAFPVTG